MNDGASAQALTVESRLRETAVAWGRFLAEVDSVPLDRVEKREVRGNWSLKTLIGHVEFWNGVEADRLAKGEEVVTVDSQPLNDQNASDNVRRSFSELRSEIDTNHARALAQIRANPTISRRCVRETFDGHYIEHGLEIEDWLIGA